VSRHRLILLIAFVAFIALGMPKAAFGVAWPSMAIDLSAPLADLGLFVAIHTGAYFVASVVSGRLSHRIGNGAMLTAAAWALTLGLAGYAVAPNRVGLAVAAVVLGLGGGLLDAGINAKTAASLSIVPLVVVAWADGVIQPQERKAILQGADEAGMTKGDAAYQLLQTWLDEKPEDSLFIAWKEYIQALAKQVNTETLQGLKDNITARIHKIAKAAGGVLGIHKVDVSEKQAMKEIESAFDVD